MAGMPYQNRVTPLGQTIADPACGLVFGNRGCLHDDEGRIRRSHAGRRWIACRLTFKDRHRALMQPGRYTELFFLDDATALAAGHRPCAECRHEDYERFVARWPGRLDGSRAAAIDAQLHVERLTEAGHHDGDLDELPDGAFILSEHAPRVVCGAQLLRWTPAGYAEAVPRAAGGRVVVVTPPSLVEVLARGWRPSAVPLLHPSAQERSS